MKKKLVLHAVILSLFFGISLMSGQTAQEEARRHFDRGMAAVEMAKSPEEYAAAIKEFEEAARLAPNWPDIYYNLGLVQEKAEKYGDAIKNFQKYLQLAPNASDANAVKSLINKLEYKLDRLNSTPELIEAVLNGNKEMVEISLRKGANIEAKCDKDGRTPLLIAIRHQHIEVAELLIANGADVNAREIINHMTPLHYAACSCPKEVVELLIVKGANVNAKTNDEFGLTPLNFAKYNKDHKKDVIEFLKKHGAKK